MGSLEIEVMNAIWTMLEMDDNKNISISDVMSFMQTNGCQRAYTTIKTVMDRLVSKGTLSRYKCGRKFFYVASVSRFEATLASVQKVSEQFFNGNINDMIHFIEQNTKSLVMA